MDEFKPLCEKCSHGKAIGTEWICRNVNSRKCGCVVTNVDCCCDYSGKDERSEYVWRRRRK